ESDPDYLRVKDAEGKLFLFHRTRKVSIVGADGAKLPRFSDIPESSYLSVTYERGKYFNDPLTESEQREFTKTYDSQVDDILAVVQPRDVGQFGGWTFRPGERPPAGAKFFTYVAGEWKREDRDISDEIWMAQEDLWLQREIFHMIRKANDYVALCQGTG